MARNRTKPCYPVPLFGHEACYGCEFRKYGTSEDGVGSWSLRSRWDFGNRRAAILPCGHITVVGT